MHFLFQTGKEEQALRLMALQAEDRADSAPLHAAHGVFLTSAHEEAERAFGKSLELDRNCWLAHYALTEMYSALGSRRRRRRMRSASKPW